MFTGFGPGIVVMLADTDAGSVITAAQSGAQWGYQLLIWQFILIPILYIAQELTVRLGLITGRGHGELIQVRPTIPSPGGRPNSAHPTLGELRHR